jgi:hypothetical protein
MTSSAVSRLTTSTLNIGTKVAVLVLSLALIGEKNAALKALPFKIGSASHNFWLIPDFWVGLLAPGFYLCALWAASSVFARMTRGDAFGFAMVKGLKDVGRNLMIGAVSAIVIAPIASFFIETNFTGMTGMKYRFSVESLTIGLIGLVLFMLAEHGQRLKSELDAIV